MAAALPSPRVVERVLAPGADAVLLATLGEWLAHGPRPRRVLDLGVGARSLLPALGCVPIGLDMSLPRLREFRTRGGTGIAGTAVALPFADRAFDAVVSAGLLHHLADGEARATLAEMIRVTRPDGRIALFDSVLPEPAWRRPLAWVIRRADRGRFVRRAAALRALLPDLPRWQTTRITYARTGLEGLWCTRA